VVTGHASLNQLAGGLKDRVAAPMARQSLHERIGEKSTAFLLSVLCDLMEQRYQPAADVLRDGANVGAEGKRCRLVAMRAAPEVVAARRAERRNKARQSGKQPCPAGLVRDGWHIMLTNLTKEQADVRQLATIYRARWAVAHPLGGGNPIPGMETSAQPRQGAQSQEQSTSSASAGIGGDDRPPTWHEHRTEYRRNDRAGQTEL
jgi:hypothetical protein